MTSPLTRSKGRPSSRGSAVGAEKIVQQTKDLVMAHGPHAATRAEIAKALGVDQKLIRYYFPDLEVLLDQALDLARLELDERMAAASEDRPTQAEILANRVAALTSFLVENPGYFRALVERIYNGKGQQSAERLVEMTTKAYRRHEGMVRRGQAAGEFRDFDPRFLYLAILGMAEIVATSQPIIDLLFRGDETGARERYQRFIADLILNGIVGASPDAELGAGPPGGD